MLDAAGQQQQAGVARRRRSGVGQRAVRLARRAVAHELDADHQARAAHVADAVVLGRDQLAQAAPSAPRRGRAAFATRPSSRIVSSTAMPAAHATGLPP